MPETETTTRHLLGVLCPLCFADPEEGGLSLDLQDFPAVTCGSCGDSFVPAEAAQRLTEQAAAWAKIAAWVETAPTA